MGYSYKLKLQKHPKREKPTRQDLCGMSPSEFKTMLKLLGFRVPRDFFKRGWIAQRNRLHRFRCKDSGLVVDVAEAKPDFDRWANSTLYTQPFLLWFNKWTR